MTQVEDLGQLATSFGRGLRALALTCDELRSLWSRSNLYASRRKFFTVWPPNQSQSIDGLLANEIQDMSALKWFFCDSRVLVRKLASAFGHPTQVSTQVQLAPTCDYLPVRLTRALNASVKSGNSFHAFHADVLLTLAKETRGRVSYSD